MSQPTLPGMPEQPERKRRMLPPGVRVVRTRPTRLCEQCCQDIHRWGQDGAPYPRAARWRVVDGDSEQRLCETHKDERCQR